MKNILVGLLFLLTNSLLLCQSIQLNTFDALLDALNNGKNVRVIIHYSKCRLTIDGKEEKAPDTIGGMDFKAFEFFSKGSVNNNKAFISSSQTVLISHTHYGYVNNYIKIRIYEDNSVAIIARYLDPKTFDIKMDETFHSYINDNQNDAAVFLFTD